tara:strand:- start:9074 stop:11446 length:2373 start_codon:yes stop_codon:yes gene_type:complete
MLGNTSAQPNSHEIIVGLETYFGILCLLLAAAYLDGGYGDYLNNISSLDDDEFAVAFNKIVIGEEFENKNIFGCRNAFSLDWVSGLADSSGMAALKGTVESVAVHLVPESLKCPVDDYLQFVHREFFPKNLMHVTGQFYTPQWLVDQMLMDVNWNGNGKLIDPFCGSGNFILRAIDRGIEEGFSIDDLTKRCIGIDLNPTACVAARCNLVIKISKTRDTLSEPVHINILNADSIAPSIAKGRQSANNQLDFGDWIRVDGETVVLPKLGDDEKATNVLSRLARYGFCFDDWNISDAADVSSFESEFSELGNSRERNILEQLAVFVLGDADFICTNPPWVGWEYISKSYRQEVQPAWDAYSLFNSRGLEASFLKEDISTISMVSAWDLYLKEQGICSFVIKPSTMKADLTGRGIRRLSVFQDSTPMKLSLVREFEGMSVFEDAKTEACCWQLTKGETTTFPVEVRTWEPIPKRWAPKASSDLSEIRTQTREFCRLLDRSAPSEPGSRWLIAGEDDIKSFEQIKGQNSLTPRMGVFTGGGNSVFYVEPVSPAGDNLWRNVTARAKKLVPSQAMFLEPQMIRPVLRGRDIQMWEANPGAHLLFPHTSSTKMRPLEIEELKKKFPATTKYLFNNKTFLENRKGFAGWERKIHEEYFYSLQRIGDYTFFPYKVCWKYIASEFTVCVLGLNEAEKETLPNDKVMFIGFGDRDEAFYYGGLLSSESVRSFINSGISKRQISANAIKGIRLDSFNREIPLHSEISSCCLSGHQALKNGNAKLALQCQERIDALVKGIYF